MHYSEGRTRVFHSMEEASAAVSRDCIEKGDMLVIRYEGPKGGPGMREMHTRRPLSSSAGRWTSVALITDGRFSGSTGMNSLGPMTPENQRCADFPAMRIGSFFPKRVHSAGTDSASSWRRSSYVVGSTAVLRFSDGFSKNTCRSLLPSRSKDSSPVLRLCTSFALVR